MRKQGGAWLTNITKESNYSELSTGDKKRVNTQIDEIILSKYKFINYNGIRRDRFRNMTDNFEKNIYCFHINNNIFFLSLLVNITYNML